MIRGLQRKFPVIQRTMRGGREGDKGRQRERRVFCPVKMSNCVRVCVCLRQRESVVCICLQVCLVQRLSACPDSPVCPYCLRVPLSCPSCPMSQRTNVHWQVFRLASCCVLLQPCVYCLDALWFFCLVNVVSSAE